jgi:lysylphosphatidylglycerol synthetase-like protein (DUF2156 family)
MGKKKNNSGKNRNTSGSKSIAAGREKAEGRHEEAAVETAIVETAVEAKPADSGKTADAGKTAGHKEVSGSFKRVAEFFRKNAKLEILVVFAAAVLALILVGALGLKEPVVPVCLAIVIETGIAVMLHNVELWIHGVAVVVQLVAGILIGRTWLMVLCVVLYVVTIVALQFWDKAEKRA